MRANRPLTFQSHARSKVTSLMDRLKYTCDVTRDPCSNRQLYQCNDCNGRFTTLQSLRDNMCSRRLCRVVKRKSCETYRILLGLFMTTHVVWSHSPVDIDCHKLRSWKVVHQCEHVNTHWWTTFQLLSLWLSMSTGLWRHLKRHMRHIKSPQ